MEVARIARGACFGLLAALLLLGGGNGAPTPRRTVIPTPLPAHADTAGQHPLPAGLAPVLATALAADQVNDYAVLPLGDQRDVFQAANPAHHLTTTFLSDALAFTGSDPASSAPSTWGMHLAAIGNGTNVLPVAAASPTLNGTRVEYRRGNVTEWYVNSPLGVEQGFTLAASPVGAGTGDLVLTVGLTGAVAADDGASGITLVLPGGGQARYGQLTAVDAMGRVLPARLAADNGQVRITVDDRGAVYPVVVDPLVQQGSKLTGNDEAVSSWFGAAVALSSDGNTALIGAYGDNGGIGAAFVFTRSGTTWYQLQTLTGSGEVGQGRFGRAVALSSDGNTALVGAPNDNNLIGSAYVYTQSGTTWSQQQRLTGSSQSVLNDFGISVAMSGDGTTALVGADGDNTNSGAAVVFTRSGTTWSQQGSKLTGSGEMGAGAFGSRVALSNDGNTALVGALLDNGGIGAAYVFTRSTGVWSQQQRLTGSGETGAGYFGSGVAVSGDGNTALIGAEEDNNTIGAAFVFTRSGTTWSQQQKLTGSGEVGQGRFGSAVAVSGDGTTTLNGNTALVGADSDNGGIGAAFVFTRSGTTWSQQGSKLTGSGETGAGGSGSGVALSGDSTTALIGADYDANKVGAAFVFTRSGTTWSQQGSKLTGGSGSGEVGAGKFGTAVAVSSDGNTALIGAYADNNTIGAAFVFTRSGTTWSQQGNKLTGSGETAGDYFGGAVALSSDGNTALIGAYDDNNTIGAAFVFTRSGTTWSQQGSKLTGTGEVGQGQFGVSVALSGDGNTALIGAWSDASHSGTAFVFTRNGTTWSQQQKLTGSGELGAGFFGAAVALSSDGNTALIGASSDNNNIGAAFVFTRSGTTWSQ